MEKKYKVIVAHPGRQHSFRTAIALKKSGLLLKYVTTVYNKNSSLLMRIAKNVVGSGDKERAANRRCEFLDDSEVMQISEIGGFVELFIGRFIPSAFDIVHRIISNNFGKKLAKYAIKEQADAVILFDTNAKACFHYLKRHAPGIIRIVDASYANRCYLDQLLGNINESQFPEELERLRKSEISLDYLRKENNYAQYIFAASQFVKKTYVNDGINEENVRVIPYGCNINSKCSNTAMISDKLRFVFVGRIEYVKGITVLIEAFKKLQGNVELTLVGKYNTDSEIYRKYCATNNVVFRGLVLHDEVRKILAESNVFVLPSFVEGMSLAGLEALGCGLPLICSENSGVNDAVTDGVNGFVVKAGDVEALRDRMQWFVDNKNETFSMSQNAYNTSLEYTWENYYVSYANKCIEILEANN